MVSVLFVGVLIAGIVLLLLFWFWREAHGDIAAVSSLTTAQLADEVSNHFMADGWDVEQSTEALLSMSKGVNVWLGLLLLLLFFPVGLLYLLTDWGNGRLTVSFGQQAGGETTFQLEWRNVPTRNQARRLLEWLEEIDQDVLLKASA